MKKKEKLKFTGKLSLNKETVVILNNKQTDRGIPFTLIFCTPFPPTSMTIPCTGTGLSLEMRRCYSKEKDCTLA